MTSNPKFRFYSSVFLHTKKIDFFPFKDQIVIN